MIKTIKFIKPFKVPGWITFGTDHIREMNIVNGQGEFYLGCCGNRKKHVIPSDYFIVLPDETWKRSSK